MQTLELKSFLKSQIAQKDETLKSVSNKIGKSNGRLSVIVKENTITVSMLIDVLKVLDEDFVLKLKDGNEVKITI